MFERFTDRARRVLVVAQEEARALRQNYIGTEHILLGCLDGEGVAAVALRALGIEAETIRSAIREQIGEGDVPPGNHIPFTPRSKAAMERSLRQALDWGHNYIGTEHLVVALVGDDGSLATKLLAEQGVDRGALTTAVQDRLREVIPAEMRGTAAASAFAEIGASLAADAAPAVARCPGCAEPLSTNLAADVVASVGEVERVFVVAYCRACGHTLNVLPDD